MDKKLKNSGNISFDNCPLRGADYEHLYRVYTGYGIYENCEGKIVDIGDIDDERYYCHNCKKFFEENGEEYND